MAKTTRGTIKNPERKKHYFDDAEWQADAKQAMAEFANILRVVIVKSKVSIRFLEKQGRHLPFDMYRPAIRDLADNLSILLLLMPDLNPPLPTNSAIAKNKARRENLVTDMVRALYSPYHKLDAFSVALDWVEHDYKIFFDLPPYNDDAKLAADLNTIYTQAQRWVYARNQRLATTISNLL